MKWTDAQKERVKFLRDQHRFGATKIALEMGLERAQVEGMLYRLRNPYSKRGYNRYAGLTFGEQLRQQRREGEAARARGRGVPVD